MTTKAYKALSRLIMYDKIKRFYEEDHQSIRWIVRELNLNFRTVKEVPGNGPAGVRAVLGHGYQQRSYP